MTPDKIQAMRRIGKLGFSNIRHNAPSLDDQLDELVVLHEFLLEQESLTRETDSHAMLMRRARRR